ncbi:hypothetical protein N7532_007860 [Penicillium argentinense]|uniref:Uncharacterized protein n=1 Tax=Penicillium argentinense TaxID=1131581 RepID=A0A9W9K1G3_9EURO|nr:uncharacterized protein N7532_007860 [Penicillium argentinense]KAJ5089176.1 hypothetical protein N7532_007860 [Penicillium argentinense]
MSTQMDRRSAASFASPKSPLRSIQYHRTRGRLRKSMSTRSIRKPRLPPDAVVVNPDVAKLHAAAAASSAMRSSQQHSIESRSSYDRLGGPAQIAIPRRRARSSLHQTEDSSSSCGVPTRPLTTPCPSIETEAVEKIHARERSVMLPATREPNGLDGRDSSVPSSYRRLRKAKSMFSTRQRPSPSPYGTPPLPRRNGIDLDRSPQFILPRTMRNSPSFTRGGNREGSRAIRHSKSHDTAIQLARDQFLDEIDEVDARPRRSSFFIHRRKREDKPFRKTFRVTSETSMGAKSRREQPHGRRRTFSASFKNGLKRVFGISKPVEQKTESLCGSDDAIAPTVISVAKSLVNCSASEHVGDTQELETSPLRVPRISPSRVSLATSKSRVTSWADSTVANTVLTRKTGHRQSLSLIEEHDGLNKQLPQVPSVPVDQTSPTARISASRRFNDWVDSHDLYNALMQQIGRQAVQDPNEDIVFGTVPGHRVIPERTSSAFSRRSRRTVRHVPSEESSTPGSFATALAGNSISPHKHYIRPLRYIPSPKTTSPIQPGQENRPLSANVDGTSPFSPRPRGGDSDDETGSVIVLHHGNSKTVEDSPSIYSQTTNGGTPIKDTTADHTEVPGTATIFTSERAIYRSPKRGSSSNPLKTQVQPSVDWQQWMSSQIERIESTSPTREHVREEAQFQEDDDEIFMGMMRRAPVPGNKSTGMPYITGEPGQDAMRPVEESRAVSQNNFSRPFSRASSVRTIHPSQNVDPIHPLRTPSKLLKVDSAANDVVSPPIRVLSGRDLSPMRMRTANSPSLQESPTPQRKMTEIQKRNLNADQYRRYSARRPMVAIGQPSSFRSMKSYRDFHAASNENKWQRESHDRMMEEYYKGQDGQSTVSSKHMVEMFLNSRRRPAGTETSENKPGEAFI